MLSYNGSIVLTIFVLWYTIQNTDRQKLGTNPKTYSQADAVVYT